MPQLTSQFRYRSAARPAVWLGVLALLAASSVWTASGWGASRDHPFGSRVFIRIARSAKPVVVNISTTEKIQGWNLPRARRFLGPQSPRRKGRDFFERFAPDFGSRGSGSPRHSLGSGVIVDPKGYILTNYHVIERSGAIKITLEDRSEYDARIVGTDPKTDIALLKIEPGRPLPAARLGNSDELEVGEWVMAIGSPFGLAHTVTVGVVSAKGRVIGSGPFDDYIQTDAYINVGNSGGPLLNTRGEVVGLNTAIVAESLGVGFAIPIKFAKAILPDLKMYGAVRRGWVGIAVRDVSPSLARTLGLGSREGALVSDVTKSGPAAVAGVRRGDIVVEFNGRRIRAVKELPFLVASARPGSRARMKLIRNGRPYEVAVDVRAADEDATRGDRSGRRLGLLVTPMTDRMARRMKLNPPVGVVIASVEAGSPAQAGGLQEGDVILEINRNPIQGMRDYRRLLRQAVELDSVLLLVRRNRNSIFVALKRS